MSRSVPWRRACSDVVHWRQLQALQARIYVLQESGPTAFVVKEEDNPKKFRVTLGDPSSCTCGTYSKERELCIHILWIILKLFRIPPENSISWQGSLVEREIQQLINSRRQVTIVQSAAANNGNTSQNSNTEVTVQARTIEEGDCCPICQEDMKANQNLTYCRYSCGHYIHSKCMKMWADHQLSQGTKIHCPMCRAEFGTMAMIKSDHLKRPRPTQNVHAGVACTNCRSAPIQGKVYQCTICIEFILCMRCFATSTHTDHPFHFKEKPSDRWRPAIRDLRTLPPQLASDLQNRDLSENDYETLLALDNHAQVSADGGLTEKELSLLKCIMLTKNSSLLKNNDIYCNLCLAGYSISQHVVTLPCSHIFHQICANNWLAHTHDYCPTCHETVVVVVPLRKKQALIRYNVKEDEAEESRVEFSLAGAAVQQSGSTGSLDDKLDDVSRANSNKDVKVASLGLTVKSRSKPKSSAGTAMVRTADDSGHLSMSGSISNSNIQPKRRESNTPDKNKQKPKIPSFIREESSADFTPDTSLAISSLQSQSNGSCSAPRGAWRRASRNILKTNSKLKLPSFVSCPDHDTTSLNLTNSILTADIPKTPPREKEKPPKPPISKLKGPSISRETSFSRETTSLQIGSNSLQQIEETHPGPPAKPRSINTPPKDKQKLSKPPRPPKSNPEPPQPNLFIGSEQSSSPGDIVKRISSVHEKTRPSRRSVTRSNSNSGEPRPPSGDINLVAVSGAKIATT